MPSFQDMRKIYSKSGTIGQQRKEMSDRGVQVTFDNDIGTKLCYIYDYFHDDQPEYRKGYNPSLSKTKTPVKLRFIIKGYKSEAKDEPEYHIMFEPDVWNSQSCVPNYWDVYDNLDINFPVSLYVDIPDDRGIYHKWLIFYDETANQFPKFGVMRCNYLFQWTHHKNGEVVKRKMWGCQRIQKSYNAGIYTYDKTTKVENQMKFWLPWNDISSEIYYDKRLIVSMPMERPITWKITKVESTQPKGICLFTLYQDLFNPDTDYVNLETGEMYADYYKYTVKPMPESELDIIEKEQTNEDGEVLKISSSTSTIKVGGTGKVFAATVLSPTNDETTKYHKDFVWRISLDDGKIQTDITDTELITTYPEYTDKYPNKLKFKFNGDESYANKIIKLKCQSGNLTDELVLGITVL